MTDEQQRANAPFRRPRRFSIYLALVVLGGALALAYATAEAASRGIAGGYATGFVLLSVLLVLSEARPMSFLRRHAGHGRDDLLDVRVRAGPALAAGRRHRDRFRERVR